MDEQYGGEMMDENPVPRNLSARPEKFRPREIGLERRKELQAIARELADVVVARTRPHERCVLRAMVETLLPD